MIKKKVLIITVLSLLVLSITGCMHIEQIAEVNEDGSATITMIQAFLQEGEGMDEFMNMANMDADEIKGATLIEVKPYEIQKKDGLYVGKEITYKVDNINDIEGVTVTNKEHSILIVFENPKQENEQELTDVSEFDEAFLKQIEYIFTMKLPGTILHTNGENINEKTVSWNISKMNPEDVSEVEYQKESSKVTPIEPIIPPVANSEALALQQMGLLKGTNKGLELERTLTRAEGAVIIKRIMDVLGSYDFNTTTGVSAITLELPAMPIYNPRWNDVPDWAREDIFALGNFGIIKGASETKFEPNQDMKAIDFTTMILRMLGYSDGEYMDFTWATSLEKAVEFGLITEEQKVNIGNGPFTRGSMAIIAHNAIGF